MKMNELFDQYNRMADKQIVLAFKGIISHPILESMAEMIYNQISESEPNVMIARKIFGIFIELVQNIYHHSAERIKNEFGTESTGIGIVIVSELDQQYNILSGNYIHKLKSKTLVEHIDYLNQMDKDSLKKAYRDKVREPRENESNGAGIGLIEIIRKSGFPIHYHLTSVDENQDFLSLAVKIEKEIVCTDLTISPQKSTLGVKFNVHSGILELSGASYPPNAFEFFNPLMKWIENYIHQIRNAITLNLHFSFINTSSSKCLLDMLHILKRYHLMGGEVFINWYYREGDEIIYETGAEICDEIGLPIRIILEKGD